MEKLRNWETLEMHVCWIMSIVAATVLVAMYVKSLPVFTWGAIGMFITLIAEIIIISKQKRILEEMLQNE